MPRQRSDRDTLSAWLIALGDPVRLAVVRALATGPKTVQQLITVATNRDSVSYHLRWLKTTGVITVDREGRNRRHTLIKARVSAGAIVLAHSSGARLSTPRD